MPFFVLICMTNVLCSLLAGDFHQSIYLFIFVLLFQLVVRHTLGALVDIRNVLLFQLVV